MKKFLLLLFCIFLNNLIFAQTKAGDVELPNQLEIEDNTLLLNGAGTREKMFMDLYAMGLYLTEKSNNEKAIIEAKSPMVARLEIISGLITAEKMEKATRNGFRKATQGNTSSIASEMEEFISVFKEKIEKKDVFEFHYLPNLGTRVYKNGNLKKEITGYEFKKALFGIWLCDEPADEDLKKGLLGQ
ncbi:MAG: chalcone isomerase family protein [Marinifilaceae bacterium]